MRTYTIYGKITLVGSQTPIDNVLVQCDNDVAFTDRNGFYRLVTKAHGPRPTFKLSFSKAGMFPITKEVGMLNWGSFDLRFNMNMTKVPVTDPDPVYKDPNQLVVAAIVYDKASETVDLRIDDMDTLITEIKKQIQPEYTEEDEMIDISNSGTTEEED